MNALKVISTLGLACAITIAHAQSDSTKQEVKSPEVKPAEVKPTEKKKAWYETISLKGYAQVRYNRFLETNGNLKCDQCDKSIGNTGGVFIRRARLVFSGQVHDRVFIHIQTDVASNATTGGVTGLSYLQLRDFYGDIWLNKNKTFRTRIGLSKVPFGFENLQSSQKRIAFDRGDALNSAIYNERDMGVFFYYTPKKIQDRFKSLDEHGLRGSGDYGVFGFGVYNGQTANRNELNNSPHVVGRVTYPFLLGEKQILELSGQAYSGWFNMSEATTLPQGTSMASNANGKDYLDQRVAASVILFPQPFGFQAEYMYGNSPRFKNFTPESGIANDYRIIKDVNEGGYIQLMYMKKFGGMTITPYARGQYFRGGKKVEKDARYHDMKELEMGVEWIIVKYLELTLAYSIADRTFEDSVNPVNHQRGNFARVQLQFNY